MNETELRLNDEYLLTSARAESNYGIPVLVNRAGVAFGPDDLDTTWHDHAPRWLNELPAEPAWMTVHTIIHHGREFSPNEIALAKLFIRAKMLF